MSDARPLEEGSDPSRRSSRLSNLARIGFQTLLGRRSRQHHIRETIEEILEEAPALTEQELALDSSEKDMLANIFRLRHLTVEDIAVSRAEIVAVDLNSPLTDILECAHEERHSRIPVYDGQFDQVKGFVHIKDLLIFAKSSDESFDIQSVLRAPLFVSPSMLVSDLLVRMRLEHTHLALMIDEYGGIDGLITIEDVVEQIMGDIGDEDRSDDEDTPTEISPGCWRVGARISLEEFEEYAGPLLAKIDDDYFDEVDTIGGLVSAIAGTIPTVGQVISDPESGLEFQIVEADPRRIHRLVVQPIDTPGVQKAADGGLVAKG